MEIAEVTNNNELLEINNKNLSNSEKTNSLFPPEEKIKVILQNYYEMGQDENLNALEHFFSDPVERFYNFYNINIDKVKTELTSYYQRNSIYNYHIDWNKINIENSRDGDYNVNFNMDYIKQRKGRSSLRKYKLNINVTFNKNFKIKEIFETRI